MQFTLSMSFWICFFHYVFAPPHNITLCSTRARPSLSADTTKTTPSNWHLFLNNLRLGPPEGNCACCPPTQGWGHTQTGVKMYHKEDPHQDNQDRGPSLGGKTVCGQTESSRHISHRKILKCENLLLFPLHEYLCFNSSLFCLVSFDWHSYGPTWQLKGRQKHEERQRTAPSCTKPSRKGASSRASINMCEECCWIFFFSQCGKSICIESTAYEMYL